MLGTYMLQTRVRSDACAWRAPFSRRALASICRHVAVNVVEAADGAAGGGAAPQPPAAEAGPAENYEMPQQHALPRAEARGFAHAVSRGQCSAAGPAPTAAGSTGGGRGVRMQVDTASQLLTTSAHGSAFAGVTEQVSRCDASCNGRVQYQKSRDVCTNVRCGTDDRPFNI